MGIKNFPVKAGPCPSLHCPPSPPLRKYIFFALPSTNGPLPAELKFRENTELHCIFLLHVLLIIVTLTNKATEYFLVWALCLSESTVQTW